MLAGLAVGVVVAVVLSVLVPEKGVGIGVLGAAILLYVATLIGAFSAIYL